jgi:hypothetical protein
MDFEKKGMEVLWSIVSGGLAELETAPELILLRKRQAGKIAQALRDAAEAEREECAKVAEDYWKIGKNVYARHSGRAVESRIRARKGRE